MSGPAEEQSSIPEDGRMRRYVITIPASIDVVLEQDHTPTNDEVADEVGRYVELQNGTHFDSDEWQLLDHELVDDSGRPLPYNQQEL